MTGSIRKALRARAQGDEGASLVLVMVFIIAVGLVVTALLSYAQTGITSARATQSRQLLASDASGAMDVAINAIRTSAYADPATQSCPADGITVPGVESSVRVTCTPAPGTGISAGTVPITALNRPGSAVLTLGTGSETGLTLSSNSVLRIKGRVYVNSTSTSIRADASNAQVWVTGAPVIAKGSCPSNANKVVSTESVTCNSPGSPPEGKDPALLTNADMAGGSAIAAGYAQPPSGLSQLVHRVVPTCPGSGTVQLSPGYYDDAVALSSLTNSCGRPIQLLPGVYYLDFRNEEMASLATGARPMTSGTNVWTINRAAARVVGGTLTTPGNFTIPGACVSPLTTTSNNQGVQLVFGGSSRIDVQAGQLELCGQYAVDRPPLVVYGAKTGATTVITPAQAGTATGTTTPAVAGHTVYANPGAATPIDAAAATATIPRPASGTTTASMRLTGSGLSAQIPAGSILVSAQVRVTHREQSSVSQDALSVAFVPNASRPSPAAASTTATLVRNESPTAWRTDTVNVLTNDLIKEIWRYGLADARIDYTVGAFRGAGSTLTAQLDAAELWLEWKPPSLRGQTTPVNGSNCIGTVGGCALITTNGAQTRLFLQGTTYAPLARFDINLTNISTQVFRSGIIARALAFSITPSAGFVGPVIEVPDETGSGVNLDVYLAAYVCTGSASTCAGSPPPSSAWRRVGRSTVTLQSAFPVPSDGSRSVVVESWNLLE
ncbi:MAG: hypothetical protein JWP95_1567 [Actinotalea sp.]|nr:hypothetical protein [Actinotalea sp.]